MSRKAPLRVLPSLDHPDRPALLDDEQQTLRAGRVLDVDRRLEAADAGEGQRRAARVAGHGSRARGHAAKRQRGNREPNRDYLGFKNPVDPWDLTEDKQNTLSPEMISVLENLPDKISATAYYSQASTQEAPEPARQHEGQQQGQF